MIAASNIIFFILILFSYNAQCQLPALSVDLEKEILIPQKYLIYSTTLGIDIDGKAIEEDWQNVPFTESFIDIEGVKKPKFNTRVKMLWDSKYLYVYALMEEPHVWGNLTEHDAIIFYNNDFEVFIDPTDDTYDYTEIEVNALNTTWDLKLNKPYRIGGRASNYYEIAGLKTAVEINGTLNDPSDKDSCWAVEMAIPLEVIMSAKRKQMKAPVEGDSWRINFSRVQWEHDIKEGNYSRKKVDGKLLPEYNWVWSSQDVINMHIPEKWGYVQFTKKSPTEKKSFVPVKNLVSKQVAYALMRKIRFGDLKRYQKTEVGLVREIEPFFVLNQRFEGTFTMTNFGFEIYIANKTQGTTFVINESGQFKILSE
jgi:hypothetical protein